MTCFRTALGAWFVCCAALVLSACGDDEETGPAMVTPSVPEEQPQTLSISEQEGQVVLEAQYPQALAGRLAVSRSMPDQIRTGRPFLTTLQVRNSGEDTVSGLSVIEVLPDGFALLEVLPGASAMPVDQRADQRPESPGADTGTTTAVPAESPADPGARVAERFTNGEKRIRWQVGTLAPGAERSMQYRVLAEQIGEVQTATFVEWDDSLRMRLRVVEPDLQVTAMVVDDEGQAQESFYHCESARLQVRVSNAGTGRTDPIALKVSLPDHLRLHDHESTTVSLQWDPLEEGESEVQALPLRVHDRGTAALQVVALTEAERTQARIAGVRFLKPEVDLRVDVQSDVDVGKQPVTRVTVVNTGQDPATEVRVESDVDGWDDLHLIGEDFELDDEAVRIGTLQPGEEATLVFAAASPQEPGTISGTITLEGHCIDAQSVEVDTEVHGVPAVMVELIDTVDPVALGDSTSLRLRVTNQGSLTIERPAIRVQLAKGLRLGSVEGPGSYQLDGDTVTLSVEEDLEPDDHWEWLLHAGAQTAGRDQTQVSVSSRATPRPVIEHEATTIH